MAKLINIELKSFGADHSELSSNRDRDQSQLPLVAQNKILPKTKKSYTLAERRFNRLNMIMNLSKFNSFIYRLMAFDLLTLMYFSYELIESFTNITDIGLTPIFLLSYIMALINTVLYYIFIIVYKDFRKEEDKKKAEEGERRIKKSMYNSNHSKEVNLNKPLQFLRRIVMFRLTTWFIKKCFILSIAALDKTITWKEYLNFLILVVDYLLFSFMFFYEKILIRLEFMKQKYGFDEKN